MNSSIFSLRSQLSDITNVEFNIFDITLNDFITPGGFCTRCKNKCDVNSVHKNAIREAARWGGSYVYYCPASLIFLSLHFPDLPDISNFAVVGGPIVMGNADDYDFDEQIINMSTTQVNALSNIALNLFSSNNENEDSKEISNILKNAYSIARSTDYKFSYPIETEHALEEAMTRGDIQTARELINDLLGSIFFNSGNNFNSIKTRIIELIVLLSRSAIAGGADIERIFILNDKYIKDVEKFTTIERLSVWLTNVINTFIGYIFEYSNVKHVEAVYKITSYINRNYNKKINLDSIAEHVYMSKSYISRIFKEETGIPLAEYINQVRVNKSKLLLADMSLSLSDVSICVGFADQSYFTKIFKKHIGMSPGKYREKNILV